MKLAESNPLAASSGAVRPLVLAAISFVLGAVLTGAWLHRRESAPNNDGLSAPVRNAVEHLAAPVAIRFYSVLPANSASADEQAFSERVANLLDAVQADSGGKIQVNREDSAGQTNVNAAEADGIKPFNLDKGDACFLGLVVSSGARKESLSRLDPQWEAALPYDVARAVLHVAAAPAPAPVPPQVAKPSEAIVSSIKRLIPDPGAVSLEEASQIFHAEFVKECAEAGTEMETEIAAAKQKAAQAQASGSSDQSAAAQKHLLDVELQQGEKLKQIAADLQTRLAVFQQMKNGATNGGK